MCAENRVNRRKSAEATNVQECLVGAIVFPVLTDIYIYRYIGSTPYFIPWVCSFYSFRERDINVICVDMFVLHSVFCFIHFLIQTK